VTDGNKPDDDGVEDDMSKKKSTEAGRDHADRRLAQARAAAKPENEYRTRKYPGKGNRNRWKKDI
jgi:hypothetical protein